ncbi:peroxin-14 [Geosmithia morbida]|uniref:Peroxisomal membrane protein PEX14 n=1 Tax=Geosmithia morbida TaxID=1094350 RepID=A0A9P4YUM0_9HYPO|nr:peroxin-14 [Geosmithia morbida]KAF4122122.1 peroxin-14 [Geosmithia morbida]
MAIREDLVASAAELANDQPDLAKLTHAAVLQDPSVASSSVENRISFLRSKNLTQEEIDAAMSRTADQRYVMPLVAPPTPEKLEQDKKSIEEQFDRAFALVEQLSKDTEELKKAEQQRTERLDGAISELETVMADLKTANRRREDDAQRVRDEIQALKDSIPRAMNNQKELTDSRLREINGELGSLKTLVSQRMSTPTSANPLRPASGHSTTSSQAATNGNNNNNSSSSTSSSTSAETAAATPTATTPTVETAPKPVGRTFGSTTNGGSTPVKASIPAWQMAFSNKNDGAATGPSTTATVEDETPATAS